MTKYQQMNPLIISILIYDVNVGALVKVGKGKSMQAWWRLAQERRKWQSEKEGVKGESKGRRRVGWHCSWVSASKRSAKIISA